MANANASIQNAGTQLGMVLGLIGSIMFMVEVGVGEAWAIIAGNTITADTASHFTGGVDFVDRTTVFLMGATVAVGLGLVGISRKNPEAVNTILKYAPWVGLAIGLTSFSSEVMDILTGEFDFDTVSDATAAMYVAITGWGLSGILSFFDY